MCSWHCFYDFSTFGSYVSTSFGFQLHALWICFGAVAFDTCGLCRQAVVTIVFVVRFVVWSIICYSSSISRGSHHLHRRCRNLFTIHAALVIAIRNPKTSVCTFTKATYEPLKQSAATTGTFRRARGTLREFVFVLGCSWLVPGFLQDCFCLLHLIKSPGFEMIILENVAGYFCVKI